MVAASGNQLDDDWKDRYWWVKVGVMPPLVVITMVGSWAGTFVWPLLLSPHSTKVPSFFKATLWKSPAAKAMTLLKPRRSKLRRQSGVT